MGDVLAFAGFAQSVAFDGLGQDDRRGANVIDGGAVGRMHFDGIVPAQSHARQLLVGKMLNHFEQARVGAEQILAEVCSALDEIFLILPVADFSETPYQNAIAVGANQAIPVRAPDHFDDIPSRTAEDGLEFLNDLSVAAHRTVEALQVAVHHENQIVEILARSQRDRSQRLPAHPFRRRPETPKPCRRWILSGRDFPDSE